MEIITELNDKQLNRLSEYLSNFSLLIVATIVLPNIFGIDRPNIIEVRWGIILTILLLIASMTLLRNKYD